MAKISPIERSGKTIPVDTLLPKTSANIVTIKVPIPLIPDLDKPILNAAMQATNHSEFDNAEIMKYQK